MAIGGLQTAMYFMRQEDQRIQAMLARHRRRIEKKARRIGSDHETAKLRLESIHDEFGRLNLLTAAVHRLLLKKQTVTPDNFARAIHDLDLADGVADGKLDPRTIRPETSSDLPVQDPAEFLRALEQREEAS